MATIHISEAEAAGDFAGLMASVRAGAEVVIEKEASPAVVLRMADKTRGRLLSESIALAEAHAKELGLLFRADILLQCEQIFSLDLRPSCVT